MEITELKFGFKARPFLDEYRALLLRPHTVPNRRNLARTLHDFCKLVLADLARFSRIKAQLDISKRFLLLTLEYPELTKWKTFVNEVKHHRDRVEHSDLEAPSIDALTKWSGIAETFQRELEDAHSAATRRKSRKTFDEHLTRVQFEIAIEEIEEIAQLLVSRLRESEVSDEVLEKARADFLSGYQEVRNLTSSEIWGMEIFDVVNKLVFVSRMNADRLASLDQLVEIYRSQ